MQENVELQPYNSFGLQVRARYFCAADSLETLREALAFAREKQLPLLVIGGGSNLLLRQDFPGLVLQIALKGIEQSDVDSDSVTLVAASGENWHQFVRYCLQHGYYGLENLALIPGCVGAAPIQNIGAYGVEVKDFIKAVTVLDIETGQVHTLDAQACDFAYRDSIFKGALRERKIVISVSFSLHKQARVNCSYKALAQALPNGGESASPEEVFETVCRVRREKLPDPKVLGNAGSFFKNPIISKQAYARLQIQWPEIPGFDVPQDDQQIKVPAAWLIDQAGWKGKSQGGAAVYEQQALVIVNKHNALPQDIEMLAKAIILSIWERYQIRLEPEVQWVPAFEPGNSVI